jgi:quercetin dioxygenase-like cupin family protein
MRCKLIFNTILIFFLAACTGGERNGSTSEQMPESIKQFLLTYPNLEDSEGRVVLDNEHVVLQRLVVPAGEWEGVHSHPGNQLYVHIIGGEWSGQLGGKMEYSGSISEDGDVGWMDAIPLSAGHNSGNTGDNDIDLIYVTLKSDAPIAPDVEHVPQVYPNLPMKLLLENERMIVQRGQAEPGQWTGVHSHPGNQVYLHIKGGIWSERRNGVQSPPEPFADAGSVGWTDAVHISEGHESGNTGDTTIDFVLVTIK